MGKIMNIKTRKKRAPLEGFAYLYHALLSYDSDFSQAEAQDICYDLYVAYIDTLRWDFPTARFEEKRKKYMVDLLRQSKDSYKTPIQMLKSLDYLLHHINDNCLQAKQYETLKNMRRYTNDLAAFFRATTGIDIRSRQTVYNACAYGLIPADNEPRRVFASHCTEWKEKVGLNRKVGDMH